MKPIIVTYSNESWRINGIGSLSISQPDGSNKEIPNSGYYICANLTTGQFANITNDQIKLFARKIKKRKTPVTNY
jgi:hypothetical protein